MAILLKAWASMKMFGRKPWAQPSIPARAFRLTRNPEADFRDEKRSNATHVSTTDPDARLYKTSPDAGTRLCFMGHAIMETKSGLILQGDGDHQSYLGPDRQRHFRAVDMGAGITGCHRAALPV